MIRYNAFSRFEQYNPKAELKKISLWTSQKKFSDKLKYYLSNLILSEQDFDKIMVNKELNLTSIFREKSSYISEIEFYNVILQIMDFQLGIDFQINRSIEFLNDIGQNFFSAPHVTEDNIDSFVFSALNLRAANGLSLIDNLANDDFLKNRIENVHGQLIFSGKSLPIFDEFIKENYYIDTQIDTDGDDFSDRVLVEITRPKTTSKIPVILCADPYYKGTNEMSNNLNSVEGDLTVKPVNIFTDSPITEYPIKSPKIIKDGIEKTDKSSNNQKSKNFPLNDYFLARGFAVAYVAGLGTRGSDGTRTTGDRAETITYCHAVNFLSGNEPGYYTRTGEKTTIIQWSNGSVGMTGRSYLGTLATATATQNPKGLKTIISESAISNWYDYYRENGLVVAPGGFPGEDADVLALDTYSRWFDGDQYLKTNQKFKKWMKTLRENQDRKTGNYNQFWRDRNYLPEANQIKIDCLYVHGLNDWNVKPNHTYNLQHSATNAKIKVVLHQGEHISPLDIASLDYLDLCNLWLTSHLSDYLKEKIVDLIPNVMVQSNRCPTCWNSQDNWGSNNYKTISLGEGKFTYEDNLANIYQKLFKQELSSYEKKFALVDPIFKNQYFVLDFRFKNDLKIDGKIKISTQISTNDEKGLLSAALYEINAHKISTKKTSLVPNRFFQLIPHQERIPLREFRQLDCDYRLISFGHINLQNIKGPGIVNKITKNQFINLSLELQPTIYEVSNTSQLRLILFGSDMKYTTQVLTPQTYTINLDHSNLIVPFS